MRAPVPVVPVLPTTAAVGGAVAAGLALDLSFPEPGLWFLAPVGVALLVLSAAGRRTLPAAGLGLLAGLTFFGALLRWAGIYVGWIAWVPLTVLEALYLAVFAAGATWALRLPGGPVVRAAAVAAWWVAVEALRARTPFGGFGWGRLAFSQADAPTLGLAALGGAPLVSFAVALVGGLLAAGAAALLRGRRGRRDDGDHGDHGDHGVAGSRTRAAALAVVLAAGVLTAGALVPRPTAAQPGELRVAAVQGNVPRAGLDFNAERRAVLDNHARATTALAERVDAGATKRPDVVLWPENSSDIDPLLNPDAAAVIDAAARAVGAPVLVGAVLRVGEENLANSTLVWEPGNGPVDDYVKQRPVPFAEYVPYREVFRRLTSAVDLVRKDFVAGTEVGLVEAAGTPLGNLICFEVVEDDLVRDAVRAGGQLLVVPTNNATFGYTDESVQQLAMSRVRAVEHGRAVAHVSTVGVSALIAPDGAVLADTGLFTTAVLEGDLPLRTTTTPATRLGAAPELALAALGVLAVLAGAARGPRRGRARPARRAGAGRPGPDGAPDPTGPAGSRGPVTEEVSAS